MTDIVGARIPIKGQVVSAEISQFYESDLCQVATICVRRIQHFLGPALLTGPRVEHRPDAERGSQGPLPPDCWQHF